MSAQIIPFPAVNRSHWSEHNEYCFEHLVRDGRSAKDAAAIIEAGIADLRDSERLLFLARRAMLRLAPIQP